MAKLTPVVAVFLVLSLVPFAHAHYVWLERDGDGPARAYFGEWIDDVREKSGGLLGRIKAPQVFLGANNEPLSVKRNENNLEIAAQGDGDLRLVDNSMVPREDKEKGGTTKTIYHARGGRAETVGKLELEIVPLKASDNLFTVLFAGAPLPKAEVTVAGPPKWERRLTTDDKGRITVPTPWAGRNVLKVTTSMKNPAAAKVRSSIARVTYRHCRSCSKTAFAGRTNDSLRHLFTYESAAPDSSHSRLP